MAKVSLIFRTDVHVADHSPPSWKGDYPAEIWSNLTQIGDLARKYQCKAVLDGGDYFHVKAPTKNSHGLVAKSASVQGGYPCDTWSIEGNHDMKFNNLDLVSEQPLGVLFESGVFKHLRDTVFEEGPVRVRVVGVPYNPNRTLEELRDIKKKSGDTYLVAVVHALAADKPPAHVEGFMGEPVFRYQDLITDEGPDVWCFGHWHQDQGIVEIRGRRFVNQGAVSRGALTKENLKREPKVSLLEFTEEGFTTDSIPLKVLPASEVFDLERKERQDRENLTIQQFVGAIKAQTSEVNPENDINTTIGTLDFADNVRVRALEFLERAREK